MQEAKQVPYQCRRLPPRLARSNSLNPAELEAFLAKPEGGTAISIIRQADEELPTLDNLELIAQIILQPVCADKICEINTSAAFGGPTRKVRLMKNHVYKVLELVGSSETSIEDAITTAIAQANKTIRNMDWFEVVQTRGHIENGKIGHYQVTLKIGFTLEV
jgi:flavin-binding protein dodecin